MCLYLYFWRWVLLKTVLKNNSSRSEGQFTQRSYSHFPANKHLKLFAAVLMRKPVEVSLLLLILLPKLAIIGSFCQLGRNGAQSKEKKRQSRDGTCGLNLSSLSGPPPRAKPSLVLLRNPQNIVILYYKVIALTNCQKLVLFHSSQDVQAQFLAACA